MKFLTLFLLVFIFIFSISKSLASQRVVVAEMQTSTS